jgi:hypothetical protein
MRSMLGLLGLLGIHQPSFHTVSHVNIRFVLEQRHMEEQES